MTITIYTAQTKDHVIDVGLGTPPANTTGGMAFDFATAGFHKNEHPIRNLAAKVLAQGTANAGTGMRAIVDTYMLYGSERTSEQSAGLVAVASSPATAGGTPDLYFTFTPEVTSGAKTKANVPNCATAYPVLAGFNYPLGSDMKVQTVTFDTGLTSSAVSGGLVYWLPTVTLTDGTTTKNGNATFLVVGIPPDSNIPPATTVLWTPELGATANYTWTGLNTSIGSAVVFVHAFSLTYGSAAYEMMDVSLFAANESVQVFCVESGGKYNVTVTWVPELMMRDHSGHYATAASSITFRVLLLPGTPSMSKG